MAGLLHRSGAIFFGFVLNTPPVFAADLSLRLLPEIHHTNANSPFATHDSASLRAETLLNWQQAGWTFNGALSAERDVSTDSAHDSRDTQHSDAHLNELFYETSLGDWELSAGQKRLSWGVGYGFRPLDTLQHEPRRNVQTPLFDGIPALLLEKFTGDSSLSLIYAVHTDWRDGQAKNLKHSGTARVYHLSGDWEIMGLGAWEQDQGFTLGSGFSVVRGDNWKFHGELAWQQDYQRWHSHLLDTGELIYPADPMYLGQQHNAWQAVLGTHWTHTNGAGVLLEYGYDGSAWQGNDWRDLLYLTQRQSAALGTPTLPPEALAANINAAAQAYQTSNPLRHNLLLRLSHDSGERTFAADWLLTLEDGGNMLTLSLEDNSLNRQKIRFGVRLYSGPADSAYGALNESLIVFATWEMGWKL